MPSMPSKLLSEGLHLNLAAFPAVALGSRTRALIFPAPLYLIFLAIAEYEASASLAFSLIGGILPQPVSQPCAFMYSSATLGATRGIVVGPNSTGATRP